MTIMPVIEVDVGRLYLKQVRDYLNRMKFRDPDNVNWIETGGWLTKTFTIRAPEPLARAMVADLNRYKNQIQVSS